MQSQKRQNYLSSLPSQTVQYHSNPNLCPKHWCQRSWSWTVLWRPTRPRTNTQKRYPFHHKGLECKRKSRDTRSDRQAWPWSIKGSRAKVNRALQRELTDHSEHSLPKAQEMTSTHGHHKVVNSEIRLNILFVAKDGEVLHSQQKQDLELTVAQIMSSLLQNSDLHWRK